MFRHGGFILRIYGRGGRRRGGLWTKRIQKEEKQERRKITETPEGGQRG